MCSKSHLRHRVRKQLWCCQRWVSEPHRRLANGKAMWGSGEVGRGGAGWERGGLGLGGERRWRQLLLPCPELPHKLGGSTRAFLTLCPFKQTMALLSTEPRIPLAASCTLSRRKGANASFLQGDPQRYLNRLRSQRLPFWHHWNPGPCWAQDGAANECLPFLLKGH